MKASKQHKHVTLRLTKDEARCLIVLAGQHSDDNYRTHGIIVPDTIPYMAYNSALDQYIERFRSFPVYDSLEDERYRFLLGPAGEDDEIIG